jgi:uncharacterized protein YjbI with pentapeptide repeats
MANPQHLDKLSNSMVDWQTWREQTSNEKVDLSNISLEREVFGRKFTALSVNITPIISVILPSRDLLEKFNIRSNLSFQIFSVLILIFFVLGLRIFLSCLTVFISGTIMSRFIEISHMGFGGLDLSYFDLHDADFSNSDLNGVNLAEANLAGANLTGTNLTRVRALKTDFRYANMTGVCIKEWQCEGAKFDGVKCHFFHQEENGEERYPNNRDFADDEFSELLQNVQKRNRLLKRLSVRLERGKNDENLRKVIELLDSSSIEAIFDPYLEDNALKNLEKLCGFGATLSPSLRLLTSKKVEKRLTRTQVDEFFKKFSNSGEIRQMRDSEHRRFLLLSGGYALIIGCSLNDISKNEVAFMEFDCIDRDFFDAEWEIASRICYI